VRYEPYSTFKVGVVEYSEKNIPFEEMV
jgi:hypothetical protein